MKVKLWLGQTFNRKYVEFDNVKEVHLNFTNEVGPRSNQMIMGKLVAIEMLDTGVVYRFEDVDELEVKADG